MFCAICFAPSRSVSPVLMRCAYPFFSILRTERTSPWIIGLLSMKLFLPSVAEGWGCCCGLKLLWTCGGSLKE